MDPYEVAGIDARWLILTAALAWIAYNVARVAAPVPAGRCRSCGDLIYRNPAGEPSCPWCQP
jgi:hypothetical protein